MTFSVDRKRETYRGPDIKLFVRDVHDRQDKKRSIIVRSWSTIKDVKDAIQQTLQVPPASQRLFFGPLLTSGRELPNHRTLHDAGIYRSGETLLLDIKGSTAEPSIVALRYPNDICISVSMFDSTPKPLRCLVQEARRGLAVGLKPDLVLEGSGGTYFLHDARKNKIAVFKPADEEPYAENNPRGYLRQQGQPMALREGIAPGEACMREVAAYLLDHDGFSGVPMTTLAEARHPAFNTNGARLNVSQGGAAMGAHSISPHSLVNPPSMKKPGSFQEFVRCDCTMDDISPSKIPVEEIHKIAILDIRLMNADRNAANLLVRRRPDNKLELVPIDHGYCLRSVCDVSWMDWCWLDWKQMKVPLSEKHKKYIANLDIESDARLLREQLNICEEAVDYFRASSAVLKAGVAAGLTLYDIAKQCCRIDNAAEVPSMMEKLFDIASELAQVAVENERWHHTAASRALAEQLCTRRRSSMMSDTELRASIQRMHKSASSAEFSSSLHGSPSDHSLDQVEESPEMQQSSVSDTTSEVSDDAAAEEKEECEEWAASFIAELSLDQITPPVRRSHRSSSITSDDGSSASDLSSSPKGFWYVPPGCSPPRKDDDEGSINWSPKVSPRSSFEASVRSASPGFSLDSSDHKERTPKTPIVKFVEPSKTAFRPPATVDVSEFKALSLDSFADLQRQDSGMTRSKSYSALASQAKNDGPGLSVLDSKNADAYENYKMYFHKFIDLVIQRETTAALHHSKHANAAA